MATNQLNPAIAPVPHGPAVMPGGILPGFFFGSSHNCARYGQFDPIRLAHSELSEGHATQRRGQAGRTSGAENQLDVPPFPSSEEYFLGWLRPAQQVFLPVELTPSSTIARAIM